MNRLLAIFFLALATSSMALAEQILYRGVFGEPESLTPDRSGVISEVAITADLFTGLTAFDATGSVVPGVAERWETSDDGLTWVFHLRPNARWSDGEPMTAGDFEFSLRRGVTPATALVNAARLYPIRNARAVLEGRIEPDALCVVAVTDHALSIELEHPYPGLLLTLAGPEGYPVPGHRIEPGQRWTATDDMVSNGPYMLESRRSHAFVRLVRNPHFHAADEVAIDTVVYLPADDVETQVRRFRSGELHINGWPGFNPQRQAWLISELGDSVRVVDVLNVIYLRFNVARPPFDNRQVRRALSLAIDRDVIAGKVLGAGEQPSWNVTPPGISDYTQAVDPDSTLAAAERRDIARRMLADAGIGSLSIEIRHPSGRGRQAMLAVTQMWKAIGVDATLHRSEIKSMIADLRRGDFDIAMTGALDSDDPERFLERFHSTSSYNTGRYASQEFDRALENARMIADLDARTTALTAAEAILLADAPVVPLFASVSRNLVSARVSGWIDNPTDVHPSRYLRLVDPTATAAEAASDRGEIP